MMASVGSMIFGSARSSKRTSPRAVEERLLAWLISSLWFAIEMGPPASGN